MNKIFVLLLALLLLCGCSSESSRDNTVIPENLPSGAEPVKIGSSSYSCVTGTSENNRQISESETANVKAYAHVIYNPSNEYIVTLTTTFVCSSTDGGNRFEIMEISASLSDAQIDGLTISEHRSDDTATIVLYLNQMSICYFQYRLSSDGTIEIISF